MIKFLISQMEWWHVYYAMPCNRDWHYLDVQSSCFLLTIYNPSVGKELWELKYQTSLAWGGCSSLSWGRELQVLGQHPHLGVTKEERHWIVAMDHTSWGSCYGSSSHSGSKLFVGKGAVHSTAMIFTVILSTLMMVSSMVPDDCSFLF